jgi:acyl CoA:acetate/3-ketoacid CoA transferase
MSAKRQQHHCDAISGFNMADTPEYLIPELYHQFNKLGHLKNIFIISDALLVISSRALEKIAKLPYNSAIIQTKNF